MQVSMSDLSRSYPPTPNTKSISTSPNFACFICAIPFICCNIKEYSEFIVVQTSTVHEPTSFTN